MSIHRLLMRLFSAFCGGKALNGNVKHFVFDLTCNITGDPGVNFLNFIWKISSRDETQQQASVSPPAKTGAACFGERKRMGRGPWSLWTRCLRWNGNLPAVCQVVPAVSECFSSSTVLVTPILARWYWVWQPRLPPPEGKTKAKVNDSHISDKSASFQFASLAVMR